MNKFSGETYVHCSKQCTVLHIDCYCSSYKSYSVVAVYMTLSTVAPTRVYQSSFTALFRQCRLWLRLTFNDLYREFYYLLDSFNIDMMINWRLKSPWFLARYHSHFISPMNLLLYFAWQFSDVLLHIFKLRVSEYVSIIMSHRKLQ